MPWCFLGKIQEKVTTKKKRKMRGNHACAEWMNLPVPIIVRLSAPRNDAVKQQQQQQQAKISVRFASRFSRFLGR